MATATIPQLEAQSRDRTGKRYAARLRRDGQLPAVIYGHKQEPLHVSVNGKMLVDILHANHQLVEVVVGEKSESCLIKGVQWDYLGDDIIHADLARVDLAEQVEVEVEVELDGEPKALLEAGAILDQTNTTIDVKCRADSIPEKITHDIESLALGESVTASTLQLPAGVELVSDPEMMIVHITVVQEVPDEEVVEAAAGEEPQVIGKDENADAEAPSSDE